MSRHRHPASQKALALLVGLLLAAALAVHCTSREPERSGAPALQTTHGDEPREPKATAAPPAAAEQAGPVHAEPKPAAERDAGAPTSLARLMQATDRHDRDLLATIERKTRAAPPATARELLALRRAGKSRAELERFIHEQLGGGVAVRLAAMEWLRAIHGEAEPERDIGVLSRPNTTDPSQRTVKPLTKKPRQ